MEELAKSMLEIRTLLYGDGESEPNKDACAQLTLEFFKDDTFRLLIVSLSKLNLGVSIKHFHRPLCIFVNGSKNGLMSCCFCILCTKLCAFQDLAIALLHIC